MPPSPCTGSIRIAHVSSSISLAHGVQIAERRVEKPAISGPMPS